LAALHVRYFATARTLAWLNQTWFTKGIQAESGMDHTREVSDVYQDIFAEGSVLLAIIYDVDALGLAVDGRFPNG
jgi:hypothetical protein